MKKPLSTIPAFADLTHDIAHDIPPELILAWEGSGQSDAEATFLLEPYRIRGTVASSDMVGLSRMTTERPLPEVLRLVSQPKEVVYSLAVAVGGQPVGRWIADNTETFFPNDVQVDSVVSAMLEVHRRLPAHLPRIGLCVHAGEFYRLGGGLFGPDAGLVEKLAEEYSRADETLLTGSAARKLVEASSYRLELRTELSEFGDVYGVTGGPGLPEAPMIAEASYPAPYPSDVLHSLSARGDVKPNLDRFERKGAVLLVFLPDDRCITGARDLMESLGACALLSALFRSSLPPGIPLKTGGRVALAALPDSRDALEVALHVRRQATEYGLSVRCGIDSGRLLVFPMPDGGWEFAGDPVNIASKQAEDCGQPGWVYITERAAAGQPVPDGQRFQWELSGVSVRSIGIPPEA